MDNKPKPTKVRATITYNSGRTETLSGTLNKDGVPNKTYSDKLKAYRNFPTVKSVHQDYF